MTTEPREASWSAPALWRFGRACCRRRVRSLLLSFLESVPDVTAKLKEPNAKDEPFEDVVKSAQDAAVLVLGIE